MTEIDLKQYPSIEVAYGFVLPSYQLLTGRFEAADNRLGALMGMGSTLALGAPLFAKTIRPDISFGSPWLIGALAIFGVITFLGLLARIRGVLILPNPRLLHETGLGKPELEFKADAIYISGQHFEHNAKAINDKGDWAIALTTLLAVEVCLFIVWIAR